MARIGISQEQVAEAAQALLDEGQNATVASIRKKLGSGSYTTISTHLTKWRETNNNLKPADIPEIPPTIFNALHQVWALAWKESQTQIRAERDGLDAVRQEIEREKGDMASEISRLEAENTVQGEELKKAEETLSEKTAALSNAENTLNQLKLENARIDERSKSTEKRAEELKDELTQLHQRFKEMAETQKKSHEMKDKK